MAFRRTAFCTAAAAAVLVAQLNVQLNGGIIMLLPRLGIRVAGFAGDRQCQAKVADFGAILAVKENVLRLQISVYYV